jgi:hypothetical protein
MMVVLSIPDRPPFTNGLAAFQAPPAAGLLSDICQKANKMGVQRNAQLLWLPFLS